MYQVSIQRDDREGREDREEVEVDKGDLEVQQNPPVAKRTWLQTATAAGVLAMVREGEALGEEELPSKKKKTPKQLRSQEPKVIQEVFSRVFLYHSRTSSLVRISILTDLK